MEQTSGLKFAVGSKKCGLCGTIKDVIQFEKESKRKGLPIIEIAFLCRTCAEKNNLLRHSKEVSNGKNTSN